MGMGMVMDMGMGMDMGMCMDMGMGIGTGTEPWVRVQFFFYTLYLYFKNVAYILRVYEYVGIGTRKWVRLCTGTRGEVWVRASRLRDERYR